jgi:predicted glycosyltransferase
MRLIFDLGHPAHFHLFKNVISELQKSGNEVCVVARQKDCLISLLEKADFKYKTIPRGVRGLYASGVQNIKTFQAIYKLAKQKPADFIVGTSLVAPYVAKLTGAKSIIFNADDSKVVPMFTKLAYPLANYIVTPESLSDYYGKKHIKHPSLHELAYLHPNRFRSNPDVLKAIGVGENEKYFLVRLVSLTAHHDIGETGLSSEQARLLVNRLLKYGKVFISAEKVLEKEFEPYLLKVDVAKIFDVMAFAQIVIGDSQTMIREAAVLGTPSIRCNTFVGRLSVIEDLQDRGLTRGFLPCDFDKLLQCLDNWLANDKIKEQVRQKRAELLEQKVDLTGWMLDFFDKLYKDKK